MAWMRLLTTAMLTGAMASAATAATVKFSEAPGTVITLKSALLASWSVRNDNGTGNGLPTGTCDFSANAHLPGLGVRDALFDPAGTPKSDAVDGAFELWVDNHQFVAPDAVDVTDDTLTAGPVTLSGLDVTVEYKAMQTTPTLRALVTFHNPGVTPVSAHFVLGTNFGSDANTGVRGASSNAGWEVTSDNATTPSDPPLLLVVFGPDVAPDQNTYVRVSDSGNSDVTFVCPSTPEGRQLADGLQVPPGGTVYLLQYLRLARTNAEALAAAPTFDTNPALDDELMSGITAAQSYAIVNWLFFGEYDVSGGGARWSIDGLSGTDNLSPVGSSCGSVPGIAVIDANLTDPEQGDAFDGGLLLFVDGEPLPVTAPVAKNGATVQVGPVTLAGVEVTQLFTALPDSPTLRTVVRVHNPADTPAATTVQLATNVGSDDHTVIRATSSGDASVSDADRWLITSDDQAPNPGDPVNTHVVGGPGAPPATPSLSTRVFDCSDTKDPNGVLAAYQLLIGPGDTVDVLLFNQLHALVSAATTDAARFDTTPPPSDALLVDIPTEELSKIANWEICRGPNHLDVLCRLYGLRYDTGGASMDTTTLPKVVRRIALAEDAIQKALTAAGSGKRGAAKKAIKAASAALKGFEKLLKTKKVKAIISTGLRDRLGTTSAAIRATVKQLPTALSG